MDAVAVVLSGPYLRQVDVPHEVRAFLDANAVRLLGVVRSVKQTEIHRGRIFREQREVHSLAVPGRSYGVRTSGPDSHSTVSSSATKSARRYSLTGSRICIMTSC